MEDFCFPQVCIAPECVLVKNEVYESLLHELKSTLQKFYVTDPKKSKDYSRIINDFPTETQMKLLQALGRKVISGGDYDLKD